jgi:hypothetical protein
MLCDARRRWRAALAAFVMTAAPLGSGEALAHEAGERQLTTVPPAPPGDGARAEQILRELAQRTEAAHAPDAKAATPAAEGDEAARGADASRARADVAAKVVAEPVEQAKRALARAHGARAAGDAAHARRLDALALEWAETAQVLLRASAAEAAAIETARRAREVGTRLDRARTLLEETQARRGRAAAELERVETEAREAAAAAASAEQGRIEAGKRGGAKVKKPADAGAPAASQRGAAKDGAAGEGAAAGARKQGTP